MESNEKLGAVERIQDIGAILTMYQNRVFGVNTRFTETLKALLEFIVLRHYGEVIPSEIQDKLAQWLIKITKNDDVLFYTYPNFLKYDDLIPSNIPDYTGAYFQLWRGEYFRNQFVQLPLQLNRFILQIYHLLSKSIYIDDPNQEARLFPKIFQTLQMLDHLPVGPWLESFDKGFEAYQLKFNQCFDYCKTVKVVCLDLFYDKQNSPSGFIPDLDMPLKLQNTQQHLELFRSKLAEYSQLLCSFDKLEFGRNNNFFVFGIFIFKNEQGQSMQDLAKPIYQLWYEVYQEHLRLQYAQSPETIDRYHQYLPSYILLGEPTVVAGVISQKSPRYENFIRRTLNYTVNFSKLFSFHLDSIPLNINQQYVKGRYLLENKPLEKRTTPIKSRRRPPAATKDYVSTLKLDDIGISLRKFEKEVIRDIEFFYHRLSMDLDFIEPEALLRLYQVEVFVYFALKWKQLAFNEEQGTFFKNDLSKLCDVLVPTAQFSNLFNQLTPLIKKYHHRFSYHILLAYASLKRVHDVDFDVVIKDVETLQLHFIQFVRLLSVHDEHFLWHWRDLEDKDSYFDSNGIPIVPLSIINKNTLNVGSENPIARTIIGLIKSQSKQASKAQTEYRDYWEQKQAGKGTHIFIDFKVDCDQLWTFFKEIHEIFRDMIDALNKATEIEIYAYLGGWSIVPNDVNESSGKVTLLFSVEKKDIASDKDFIDFLEPKLNLYTCKFNEHHQNMPVSIEIRPNYTFFESFGLMTFAGTLGNDEAEDAKAAQLWFKYWSQKNMYFNMAPAESGKWILKGLRHYKRSKKKKV